MSIFARFGADMANTSNKCR